MKYHFAKEFNISPSEFDKMTAEDADMLMLISEVVVEKQKKEQQMGEMKAKAKAR